MDTQFLSRLTQALPDLPVLAREPLCRHTSFRIGGPAELFVSPGSPAELGALLRLCRAEGVPVRVLGAGTNVLAPDEGLPGLVLCTKRLNAISAGPEHTIRAQCGASLAALAVFAQSHGLTGLEFAHGIPGTVGGGMVMNAGAYGGEMVQVAGSTTVMYHDGSLEVFRGSDQGLSYRHSAFMGLDAVVLETTFRLTPGDKDAIQARMRELMDKRRASQPLELPSAGSTFKRPVGGYAAALIQNAGLKGFRIGDAAVSEKHSGFVVNLGSATAADVLALVAAVRQRVLEDSGIALEPEVRLWGAEDSPCRN